jgi:shikimate dehydrogenase
VTGGQSGGDDGPRSFLVGLIGEGVTPSLSPEMHEREAARHGMRYVYKTIELDGRTDQKRLSQVLDAAVALGFDGLNVTHPFKQAILPLVGEVTDSVAAIGALNTILIREGRTSGHNTDVTGFERAFREGLPGAGLAEVVLLGAGGAGTAVAHALSTLGVARLLVVDRDMTHARRLVASVRSRPDAPDLEAADPSRLAHALRTADGLVNATPYGMAAHPEAPFDVGLLRSELWVADIVYRPLVTALLRAARDRGCRTLSGGGMAVHQAADSFELFTGTLADRSALGRDLGQLVAPEIDVIDMAVPIRGEPEGRT